MDVSFQSVPDKPDLLLVNPSAGGGRAQAILTDLQEFARRKAWQVDFRVTQGPDDLAFQARCVAAAGQHRILVLGGDGTFQVLVNSVRSYPETILGVIPAGGGNDLASALGLPQDPIRATELLLKSATVRELDAVRVQTAEGVDRLYIGGGGVGLDAEASGYASGVYRNLRGRSRYVLSAIRALSGFKPIRVRLHMEGPSAQQLEASALLAGILNTPSYGAGVRLAPDALADDGILNLVLLEDLGLLEIVKLLPALALRGKLDTKKVRHFQVARVRIETDTPCRFHGDGEVLGTTPVEISVMPRALRMLCPNNRQTG